MKAVSVCIILLLSTLRIYAQRGSTNDTVYYDAGWHEVARKNAKYYRIPAKKVNDKYDVEYHRIDHTIYYTGTEKAILVNGKDVLDQDREIKDGYFVYYRQDGSKSAEGNYRTNQKTGTWSYYFKTGKLQEKEDYYEGQPVRYSTNYYEDGTSKKSEGMMVRVAVGKDTSYKEHEQWIMYHQGSGKVSTIINFWMGGLDGPVKYFDSNENLLAEGGFSYKYMVLKSGGRNMYHIPKPVKNGVWKYYNHALQLTTIQKYTLGMLDSEMVIIHTPSGKIQSKGTFRDGVRIGTWQSFYTGTDILASDIVYKNGKGIATYYDSLRQRRVICEGKFLGKEREGAWTFYSPNNGKVVTIEHYENNQLDGISKSFDSTTGLLKSELSFKNGARDGICRYYYDGREQKWVEIEFRNDTLTGFVSSFHENGKIKRSKGKENNGEFVYNCFDEVGNAVDCLPFRVEATFDGDLMTYIGDHLTYPAEAGDMKLEGKTKVGFLIDEYGSIKKPFIVEGFDERCDNEALRLVASMPPWIPETIEGVPVKTYKVIPIVFWAGTKKQSEAIEAKTSN